MSVARLGEQILQRRPEVAMAQLKAARRQGRPSISVVGLGRAGSVSTGCLAHLGFRMVGVDISASTVADVAAGRSPVIEDRLGELLSEGVERGLVRATHNLVAAVLDTDVTFVCVDAPAGADGSSDLGQLRQVARAIGQALSMKASYHVVVVRSQVPPGTTLGVVAVEIERAAGRRLGPDFGLCFNPLFLREGSAVADFYDPPRTVIGASDHHAQAILASIYASIVDNVLFTTIAAAEMIKHVDGVWQATRAAYGNEIGRLCKALDIDGHEVMGALQSGLEGDLSPNGLTSRLQAVW